MTDALLTIQNRPNFRPFSLSLRSKFPTEFRAIPSISAASLVVIHSSPTGQLTFDHSFDFVLGLFEKCLS
jgi:hypothetical protein